MPQVRYTLGHTLSRILTLQSAYATVHGQGIDNESVGSCSTDAPLSRHLLRSLRELYAHHGLRIFFKGLYVGAIYRISKVVLTSLLAASVFRHAKLSIIAEIVAKVLLAETHMYWTHATILTRRSHPRVRLWPRDLAQWKKILLPSLVQASAIALLRWISRTTSTIDATSSSDAARTVSGLAVARVLVALIVQAFVLAPTTVWLTLAEAKSLDRKEETLVYDRTKGRFMNIGAVFAGDQQNRKELHLDGVSLPLCLWLLELHLKKCAAQMVSEGAVSLIAPLAIVPE